MNDLINISVTHVRGRCWEESFSVITIIILRAITGGTNWIRM